MINSEEIRQAAQWLNYQSVSSDASSSAPITKADLENFKNNVVLTLLRIADALES